MSALSDHERDDLSLLLPWYANGTLDDDDRRRVDAALAVDDALAREYALVLEDQATMIDLVSEEEVPASMAERFKAALNAEQAETAAPSVIRRETGESVITRVLSALFPERPRAYAFVAAAVILLVPAVAIFSIMNANRQAEQYQTASGEEDPATANPRMLVKFNPAAAWTDIDTFLKENRGQVVKGPTADGLYELEFETIDGIAEKMGAETSIFEFVLPGN